MRPSAVSFFVTSVRLWFRFNLPWRTKGYLREESRRLTDERDANSAALKAVSAEYGSLTRVHTAQATELNDTRKELKGERQARVTLEGQRIQEHEAVRRMMFGLSHGLEGTLRVIHDFIVELPDYTPQQSDRAEVMQGLTAQALGETEEHRRLREDHHREEPQGS